MARKQDRAAERARKQKIFLAVAGVLFVGVAAFQGPKLLKQLKGSEAPATVASSTPAQSPSAQPGTAASPTGTSTPSPAPLRPAHAPKSAKAQLAGVVIVTEQPARAAQGQLDSFSMFDAKDPFEQQVDPDAHPAASAGPAPTTTAPVGSPTPSAPAPTGVTGGAGAQPGAGSAGPTSPPAPPAALTMAMLRVNGVLQVVQLKGRFPRGDKMFVLRKLARRGTAVIAVAGGSFSKGSTLTLNLGKSVTLVNTATGARYVVKLVWLGADASQVARFTSKAK